MKKLTPYLSATLFFVLVFVIAGMAQTPVDSTANIFNLIGPINIPASWKPWIGFGLAVYEAATRLYPTLKNYSIAGNLFRLYQWLLPNRNAATPSKPHT